MARNWHRLTMYVNHLLDKKIKSINPRWFWQPAIPLVFHSSKMAIWFRCKKTMSAFTRTCSHRICMPITRWPSLGWFRQILDFYYILIFPFLYNFKKWIFIGINCLNFPTMDLSLDSMFGICANKNFYLNYFGKFSSKNKNLFY